MYVFLNRVSSLKKVTEYFKNIHSAGWTSKSDRKMTLIKINDVINLFEKLQKFNYSFIKCKV